jgi:hypothetical protein
LPFICVHHATPPSAPRVLPRRSLVDLLQPKMVPGCVLLLPGDPCILGVPGSSMVDLLQPKVVPGCFLVPPGAPWCSLVVPGCSLGAPCSLVDLLQPKLVPGCFLVPLVLAGASWCSLGGSLVDLLQPKVVPGCFLVPPGAPFGASGVIKTSFPNHY